MKRFIRIYGLVAFVVVTAVLACSYYFLADSLLKCAVEEAGTRAAGAKVELKEADLTLMPLGITLTGLEVTDKDTPMTNLIEVDRIAFLMEGGMALRKKLIVKDMAVEGIAFGTERSHSGALPVEAKKEKKKDTEEASEAPGGMSMFSLDVPDIDEVLNREELNTLKLAGELETDIKGKQDQWAKRIAELPDAEDLKKYEARIKSELEGKKKPAEIAKAVTELKKIRDEINRDIKSVQTASNDLEAEVKAVELKVNELKRAPQDDVNRLAKKYSLTPEGLGNMSTYFFGDRIQKYVRQARKYHGMATPYIEEYKKRKPDKPKHVRGKGIDVRFKEYNPRPDFLIERTAATATLSYGDIEGEIKDITTEQNITGKPTDFELSGTKLEGMDSLKLSGSLDHRKPEAGRDSFNITANGLGVDGVELSSSKDFPVKLSKAKLNVKTDGVLSGGKIDATIKARFSSVRMQAGKKGSGGAISKTIASSLESVRKFSLTARVTGDPESPKIDISSDLDKILKQAAQKAVRDQANLFKKDLEKKVRALTGGKIKELDSSAGSLGGLRNQLKDSEKRLKGTLEEAKKEPKKLIKTPSLKKPGKALDKIKIKKLF
jgi:uncharacterized protein (TIGR03545 family)